MISDREKRRRWEALSQSNKHMILMALYRLETEPMSEHNRFVEIYYYRQIGLKRDDLPLELSSLSGEALKRAGYSAIGLDPAKREAA